MRSGILLLGTGPSSGIPQLRHVMNLLEKSARCSTCVEACKDPKSVEKRNNVSCLIVYYPSNTAQAGYLLVDVGKTFRDSLLRWFVHYQIPRVDAVLITHSHADAVGGFDDLRDIQKFEIQQKVGDCDVYDMNKRLPVHLSHFTMKQVAAAFPYIVSASSSGMSDRRVAMLQFNEFDDSVKAGDPLILSSPSLNNLKVRVFPVWHGGDYTCMGYVFGEGFESVVYISDVSLFPEATIQFIDSLGPFKVLIMDAFNWERPHFSHLCVMECLDFIKRWRPLHSYLVGFTCRYNRAELNKKLELELLPRIRAGDDIDGEWLSSLGAEGIDTRPGRVRKLLKQIPLTNSRMTQQVQSVQIAQDGLFVPVDFTSSES